MQKSYGGIAQLGEHLLCKQGVIGSIPIISTSAGQGLEEASVSGNDSAKQRCKAGSKKGLIAQVVRAHA